MWFPLWQQSHILWETGVCSLHLHLKLNQSSLRQIGASRERNPKQPIAPSRGSRSQSVEDCAGEERRAQPERERKERGGAVTAMGKRGNVEKRR